MNFLDSCFDSPNPTDEYADKQSPYRQHYICEDNIKLPHKVDVREEFHPSCRESRRDSQKEGDDPQEISRFFPRPIARIYKIGHGDFQERYGRSYCRYQQQHEEEYPKIITSGYLGKYQGKNFEYKTRTSCRLNAWKSKQGGKDDDAREESNEGI